MSRFRNRFSDSDDTIALSDSEERYEHQLLEEDEDEDEDDDEDRDENHGNGYDNYSHLYLGNRFERSIKPNKIVEQLQRASSRVTDRSRKRIARRLVQGKSAWRRVVTGDKDKRVRDWVRDYVKRPPVVKLRDKISFTTGVVGIGITEALCLQAPQLFWAWYLILMAWLLSIRYFLYLRKKWGYFMIDFCYFANLMCTTQILLFPTSTLLFQINYALCTGPLLWAVVVWRNSLVFHSLDKVTTVYVHVMPPILTWCWRWYPANFEAPEVSALRSFWYPLGFYLLWQILYLLKTECMDREKLRNDPNVQTSLRWLASDTKMGVTRLALMTLRALRLMKPEERFNAQSFKSLLTLVALQLLYTVLTVAVSIVCYGSKSIHSTVMLSIFLKCIWNGASYYMEVFGKSPIKKFE